MEKIKEIDLKIKKIETTKIYSKIKTSMSSEILWISSSGSICRFFQDFLSFSRKCLHWNNPCNLIKKNNLSWTLTKQNTFSFYLTAISYFEDKFRSFIMGIIDFYWGGITINMIYAFGSTKIWKMSLNFSSVEKNSCFDFLEIQIFSIIEIKLFHYVLNQHKKCANSLSLADYMI